MMGKMGIGLVAVLGKALLGGGTAGGAPGAWGGMARRMLAVAGGERGGGASPFARSGGGKGGAGRGQGGRGRKQQAEPLEEALRQLFAADRSAGIEMDEGKPPLAASAGEASIDVAELPSDAAAERRAALAALLAHITSFTDGRVRLRHSALRADAVHAPLREALELAGCFTGLTFSRRTGSLLLEYDPQRHSRADFLEAALPVGFFLARCEG